jgi:hypothetical protein
MAAGKPIGMALARDINEPDATIAMPAAAVMRILRIILTPFRFVFE